MQAWAPGPIISKCRCEPRLPMKCGPPIQIAEIAIYAAGKCARCFFIGALFFGPFLETFWFLIRTASRRWGGKLMKGARRAPCGARGDKSYIFPNFMLQKISKNWIFDDFQRSDWAENAGIDAARRAASIRERISPNKVISKKLWVEIVGVYFGPTKIKIFESNIPKAFYVFCWPSV